MSYLIALPCLFVVYFHARRQELPGTYFAAVTLLLTVIMASSGLLVPGIDALVGTCLAMGGIGLTTRYIDQQLMVVIDEGLVVLPKPAQTSVFCTRRTHDFAVNTVTKTAAVERINSGDWRVIEDLIGRHSVVDRQGFYADLNYSEIDEIAVLNFVNRHPGSADGHILYGHIKLCKAKRQGLIPGLIPQEAVAQSVAEAFKHFRLALRSDRRDAEAICGILVAKGFIALRADHIEESLQRLLEVDPNHLHGVLAAARFLITSGDTANRFVSIVEQSQASPEIIQVLARIVAHVESSGMQRKGPVDSRVIVDLYKLLRSYKQLRCTLSPWQRRIAANIVAFAFDGIGDSEEKSRNLSEVDGQLSAYPWKSGASKQERELNSMGFLAV